MKSKQLVMVKDYVSRYPASLLGLSRVPVDLETSPITPRMAATDTDAEIAKWAATNSLYGKFGVHAMHEYCRSDLVSERALRVRNCPSCHSIMKVSHSDLRAPLVELVWTCVNPDCPPNRLRARMDEVIAGGRVVYRDFDSMVVESSGKGAEGMKAVKPLVKGLKPGKSEISQKLAQALDHQKESTRLAEEALRLKTEALTQCKHERATYGIVDDGRGGRILQVACPVCGQSWAFLVLSHSAIVPGIASASPEYFAKTFLKVSKRAEK